MNDGAGPSATSSARVSLPETRRWSSAGALLRAPDGSGRLSAPLVLAVLSVAVVVAACMSMTLGAIHIAWSDVVRVTLSKVHIGSAENVGAVAQSVVTNVRLPRTLLSLIVGAGLGIAGATLQGVFRNPLADGALIGVSSGAALGAVIAIVVGVSTLGGWGLPLFAFIGALSIAFAVYRISRRDGRTEVVTLILTGIAVNAMIAASIGFFTARASDQQLRSIVFWQLGSVANASWRFVAVAALWVGVGIAVLPRLAKKLDLLALGEREAKHLGVDTERLRITALGISAAVIAGCVSVTGVIAFVGLVIPHLIRIVCGPRHSLLLPASALGGATLLALADLVARTAAEPAEVPLGVVTSGIGGIAFLLLLLRTRRDQGGWA
jgi:iron complex transport system permease protein